MLVAFPVDARPVVRSQVVQLAACAGWELRVPAVEMLGHLRRAADRDALTRWLLEQSVAPEVRGFALSLDMLLYGGLVPSRIADDSLEALQARLALLRELQRRRPDAPIYAFAATMRISNNDIAEEEKPYWAQYGRALWRWSYHSDHAEQTGDTVSARAAEAAAAQIPQPVRDDYRATRARNFALVRQALALTGEGVIRRLALPQDDTAPWGFNVAERRALQAEAEARGLLDRVHIAAGADEVLHTLVARLVATLEQRPALRVQLLASDPAHLDRLVARYEDRPLRESIAAQVAAVGAELVSDERSAELVLAVHSQGSEQGDWALGVPLPQRPGVAPGWLDRLAGNAGPARPVVLADLAYANGGDPWLAGQPLAQLASYSGWNTASNSLGGLLAHAVLAQGRWQASASREVLALRLLEDLAYQAVWRGVLRAAADEATLSPQALHALAREIVIPGCNALAAAWGLGWRVADLRLPWDRSFEVELKLEPAP